MLTFESQDETDTFLSSLRDMKEDINEELNFDVLEVFYGAYALHPGEKDGFVWYISGQYIKDKIQLPWNDNEPNNWSNIEWCGSIAQPTTDKSNVGMNDFNCYDSSPARGMICQKRKKLGKSKGYKKLNS